MDFEKSALAGYLANHMARLFAHALQTRVKPLGLTPGQFMALLELWEAAPLTQKQLTERLDVEQATMANTLARLERDGLIERHAHPADGRAQLVHLTDRARALEEPAKQAAAAVNAEALVPLDAEERAALLHAMRRVIAALSKQDAAQVFSSSQPEDRSRP